MRLLTGNLIFFIYDLQIYDLRFILQSYIVNCQIVHLKGLEGLLELVVEAEGVGIHATVVVVALDDLRTQ